MNKKVSFRQFRKIDKLKGDMRLAGERWPTKYQTLISIILSARTLDETTIKVCKFLFEKCPNAKSLSELSEDVIQGMIKPINFYKNKSKNILACATILKKEYRGEVPLDYNQLIMLPGVGNKTANIFLSEYGKDCIGVDTHVYYISRYLGWSNSNKPENVEKDLKKLFPKKIWKKLNSTLVKFGKRYTSRREKRKILDEIKRVR